MPLLELDQNIHVALFIEIFPQYGAEQGELFDMIAYAEPLEFLMVYNYTGLYKLNNITSLRLGR